MVTSLVGAIDQGTSSTRFIIFSTEDASVITYHQIEVQRYYPQRGWVEQDPNQLFQTVLKTLQVVRQKLLDLGFQLEQLKCIGLTNQRESCVVWDRISGEPLCNSIVWLDNRTTDLVESLLDRVPERDLNYFKMKTGLPIATYFTALKLRWLLMNDRRVQLAYDENRLMAGTVDSWLLWKLTNVHATDVTNASRTMLMNIQSLDWDEDLCFFFKVPREILPKIYPSSHRFGEILPGLPFQGVPISGVIGDQNAALVGQQCFKVGNSKITYGTGCFLQQNLGKGSLKTILQTLPRETQQNMIITVAYHFGDKHPVHYALEGSIAIAGAAFTWLRDNLELVENYSEIELVAGEDSNTRGLYFVPALQGLYAPYWDPNASGTIIGLTQFSRKCHLVRATIEGVAFQTNDLLDMMTNKDRLTIKVDGGLSTNDLLCQILADISGHKIIRAELAESTALGAAIVAGYKLRLWPKLEKQFNQNDYEEQMFEQKYEIFQPNISKQERERKIENWHSAVDRSRQWVRVEQSELRRQRYQRLAMLPLMKFALITFATIIYSRSNNRFIH